MANNKLILRTLTGWNIPFADTTKNTVLTHADVDNNFIYLKGEVIYSAGTSGSNLILNKVNGTSLVVPISASGTSSGNTYTNSGATPTTIGGISAGSTFNTQTMQQMWDALLYPYQYPATNISGGLFTTYEFGQLTPTGLQTINYTVSNSSNIKVQPPDVGNPSTNIGIASFPLDPFTLLGSGTFQIDMSTGITYTNTGSLTQTRTVTLQGTNTQSGTFSNTKTLTWSHKRYWGTHPTFTLPSDAQIIAANGAGVGSGSEFSTTRTQTRNGIDGGGNYIFFAWPTTFGTPSFTVNGLPNTAWTKVGTAISFVNSNGHTEPYDVWISNTAQFSPITLFAIS